MGAAQPVEDFVAELDSKYISIRKRLINTHTMDILGLFLSGIWLFRFGIEKVC